MEIKMADGSFFLSPFSFAIAGGFQAPFVFWNFLIGLF